MDLQTFGISLVVVAIVLGLGGEVMTDMLEDACDDSTGNWTGTNCGIDSSNQSILNHQYNITQGGIGGLTEMGDRLDTVGLIAVVGVILGIIMVYLGRKTAE